MALSSPSRHRRSVRLAVAAGLVASLAAGCTSDGSSDSKNAASANSGTGATTSASSGLFDASFVHDIEVTFDQKAYDEMIANFQSTGDKGWIEATVVIDGQTYTRAGIRLKGNSSLMGLRNTGGANGGANAGGAMRGGGIGGGATADTPNALPWLVRLDKYVKGQNHKGSTEMVVRSNNSQTALNEAVALELLGKAGQVTELAFSTRFSVNGSAEKLRLVVENPGDEWDEENFTSDGVLYKAESGGDYSYRGDDADSYKDIFDQETDTDNVNFAPLTAFLKFINESDDATFAAELGKYLEVDVFAQYLAVQDLLANTDDIDGPGNNSYLRYDETTGRMTVVTWDLNLAFGGLGGGGGGGGFPGGANAGGAGGAGRTRPDGATGALPGGGNFTPPSGATGFPGGGNFTPPSGATGLPGGGNVTPPSGATGGAFPGGGGGFGGRSNILVTRFKANAEFQAKYDAAVTELRAKLYGSNVANDVLTRWKTLLTEQASDLVPVATIDQEAASIQSHFTS